MKASYDISSYIAMAKMSGKTRILVEGKDDKGYIKNLLIKMGVITSAIKIDTAEDVRGDCNKTYKCNRAKIEKISNVCNKSNDCSNVYFFCDREFNGFDVGSEISDLIGGHYTDGRIFWTYGHSIENYFFDIDVISDAFNFLCDSEYKFEAINILIRNQSRLWAIVSAIALSGRGIENFSFSHGTIKWNHFKFVNFSLDFCIDEWLNAFNPPAEIHNRFASLYKNLIAAAERSDMKVCGLIARGHTGVIMLQRIFSACLLKVAIDAGDDSPERDAKKFSSLSDDLISAALSEAWARKSAQKKTIYPDAFVNELVA